MIGKLTTKIVIQLDSIWINFFVRTCREENQLIYLTFILVFWSNFSESWDAWVDFSLCEKTHFTLLFSSSSVYEEVHSNITKMCKLLKIYSCDTHIGLTFLATTRLPLIVPQMLLLLSKPNQRRNHPQNL